MERGFSSVIPGLPGTVRVWGSGLAWPDAGSAVRKPPCEYQGTEVREVAQDSQAKVCLESTPDTWPSLASTAGHSRGPGLGETRTHRAARHTPAVPLWVPLQRRTRTLSTAAPARPRKQPNDRSIRPWLHL